MHHDLWEKAGEIAGWLALANDTVTLSGPVLLANINGVDVYGIQFIGGCGKVTMGLDAMNEAPAETVAGRIGAKLF